MSRACRGLAYTHEPANSHSRREHRGPRETRHRGRSFPVVNPLTAREHGNPVASNPVVEVELYVAVIVKDPRVAGVCELGVGGSGRSAGRGGGGGGR
jgi:hypothetical protein